MPFIEYSMGCYAIIYNDVILIQVFSLIADELSKCFKIKQVAQTILAQCRSFLVGVLQ